MKVVINKCYGGFGLSDQAYEKLIEWGVPVCAYSEDPEGRKQVIFDRTLTPGDDFPSFGRYWDTWLRENRSHNLLIQVVEELGEQADGMHAELKVVEIPDGVDYEIDDYDGIEHVAEAHRTWG